MKGDNVNSWKIFRIFPEFSGIFYHFNTIQNDIVILLFSNQASLFSYNLMFNSFPPFIVQVAILSGHRLGTEFVRSALFLLKLYTLPQ